MIWPIPTYKVVFGDMQSNAQIQKYNFKSSVIINFHWNPPRLTNDFALNCRMIDTDLIIKSFMETFFEKVIAELCHTKSCKKFLIYDQSHKKRSSDTSYQLSISGHYYLVFKIGIYKGSP